MHQRIAGKYHVTSCFYIIKKKTPHKTDSEYQRPDGHATAHLPVAPSHLGKCCAMLTLSQIVPEHLPTLRKLAVQACLRG